MGCLRTVDRKRQGGVTSVEFALTAMIFFTIVFGILELGRMMYIYNTLQEVTRRAARAAAVLWVDQTDQIKQIALFGATTLPAGAEVTSADITIEYLNRDGNQVAPFPTDPGDNLSACGDVARTSSCIFSVRVSVAGVSYRPMVGLFDALGVALPTSATTVHAESMGFVMSQ